MKKNRKLNLAVSLCFLLLAPFTSMAMDLESEIKACASTAKKNKRLDCYDKLSAKVLNPQFVKSESAEDKSVAKDEISDGFGGGAFRSKAGKAPESERGLLTGCQKSADGRWFYVFENGQVWKQIDRRKRRYKECDSYATITKASFGYVLEIEGIEGKIRVNRFR